MFNWLKKKEVAPISEMVAEELPSMDLSVFATDVSKLRIDLVSTFTEHVPIEGRITDGMKKTAIQNLIRYVSKRLKDNLTFGETDKAIMLVSSSLGFSQSTTYDDKLCEAIFRSVLVDFKLLMKDSGIDVSIDAKARATSATIPIDALKKFSNFEKLGLLK